MDRTKNRLGCGMVVLVLLAVGAVGSVLFPQANVPAPAAPRTKVVAGPAPAGQPLAVARRVIRDAGHPCGRITAAIRLPQDGSVRAICRNGQRYMIFAINEHVVALRCSVAQREFGITGC